MLGGDENDVMKAWGPGLGVDSGGDGDSGIDERLGVNLAVHHGDEQFVESSDLNVGWRKLGFVGIQAGAGNVVVKGQNIDGGRQSGFELF